MVNEKIPNRIQALLVIAFFAFIAINLIFLELTSTVSIAVIIVVVLIAWKARDIIQ